jgi:parvulin-like peptidyl-prolyl isomerase
MNKKHTFEILTAMYMVVWGGVLSTFAADPSAPRSNETIRVDGIAAHVNGTIITRGDVFKEMSVSAAELMRRVPGTNTSQKMAEVFEVARNALVERQLVLGAYAARDDNQKLPEWVVDSRINEIVHEEFNDDRSALLDMLSEQHMTYDEWRKRMEENLIVRVMRQENVDRWVNVSPAMVRRWYDEHQDDYLMPAKIRLRAIVIFKRETPESTAAQRKLVIDIKLQLNKGGDFAALARQYSEDNKASDGGDWGQVETALLQRNLAIVAARLKPGETSKIIETGDGYYIFKSEGGEPAGYTAFEDARDAIEKELRKTEMQRVYTQWIDRLKRAAYIHIPEQSGF